MTPHPLLPHFLRIAYECMGCDGEVVDSEVSCLRSVAVQLGQPVDQIDGSLTAIRAEFSADDTDTGTRTRNQLLDAGLTIEDAILLLDLLVQMVEADGKVHVAENRYIRDLVDGLGLDRAALRQERPEWRPYLVENIRVPAAREPILPVRLGAFELPGSPRSGPQGTQGMILDNPFHVLGLLADSGVRERAGRRAQIQAYLRVGQPLVFDDDLYSPACHRNQGTVDRALSDLHDAKDRIGFGLFWFTASGGVLDDHALRLLRGGDLQGAISVWARVENQPPDARIASCLNNLGTACLLAALTGPSLGQRWPDRSREPARYVRRGLSAKARVVGSLAGADLSTYCKTFSDGIAARDPNGIAEHFGEALGQFSEEARNFGVAIPATVLGQVVNDGGPRTAQLADRFVRKSRLEVEEAISACEDTDGSGAADAGARLMAAAEKRLPEVAAVLGKTNVGYTSLADRAGSALLNAAVAHWNHHNNQSADSSLEAGLQVARASQSLARSALEVACGIAVRERARENLATVDEIISEGEMALVRLPIKEWLDRAYGLLKSRLQPQARIDFVRESLMAAQSGPRSVISLLQGLRQQGTKCLGPGFLRGDEMIEATSLVCGALMGHAVVAYNESYSLSRAERAAAQSLLRLRDHFGPVSDLRTQRSDPGTAVLPVSQEVWERLQSNTTPLESQAESQVPAIDQLQALMKTGKLPTPAPTPPAPVRQGCLIAAVLLAGLALVLVLASGDSSDRSTTTRTVAPPTVERPPTNVQPPTRARPTRPSLPGRREAAIQRTSSQLAFTVPPIGTGRLLTLPELRWCIRQDGMVERAAQELEGSGQNLDRERLNLDWNKPGTYASEFQLRNHNAEIDRYNHEVQAYQEDRQSYIRQVGDYNSRCGNFRYRPGDLERARRDVSGSRR